jgi:hypothetical protein
MQNSFHDRFSKHPSNETPDTPHVTLKNGYTKQSEKGRKKESLTDGS